jgi:hypothetical protein
MHQDCMMENVVLSIMTGSLEGRGDSPLQCIFTIDWLADHILTNAGFQSVAWSETRESRTGSLLQELHILEGPLHESRMHW